MKCKICSSEISGELISASELSIGLGGQFDYFECLDCGCLQIAAPPKEMGKYYKFNFPPLKTSFLKDFIRQSRDEDTLFGAYFGLAEYASKICGYPPNPLFGLIKKYNPIQHGSKVLDVGCGSGVFLKTLQRMGGDNLYGLDLYIEKETPIMKRKTIFEMEDDGFDLITFNQSFEHIWEQKETLEKAVRLLSEDGVAAISLPIKSEPVWKRWGVKWANMDAPRHFFLHTKKSLLMLAEQCGLELVAQKGISDAHWFAISEKYAGKQADMEELNAFADELNASYNSDLVVFLFKKKAG